MREVALAPDAGLDAWRAAARRLVACGVTPDGVAWRAAGGQGGLFAVDAAAATEPAGSLRVSRRFAELAETVIRHRDPARFGLLYALLWRLHGGERALLDDPAEPLVAQADRMAHAVRRDIHWMHAYLRFREVGADRFVAWFEPAHFVVRAAAPFFVRRFAAMRWSILTPDLSAHWDGDALSFAPGATRADAPASDPMEEDWSAYYASVFNPARVNPAVMRGHMPKRYWRNLPEATQIPGLIAEAPARARAMVAAMPSIPPARSARIAARRPSAGAAAAGPVEEAQTLAGVARAVAGCRACPLWEPATGAVAGEGPPDAAMMLVGEQPGDQEDLAGRPFVGPAGRMLDKALAEVGLDRAALYLTNAVKHFKFQLRGKRRLHQNPDRPEIEHCRWWLDQERALLRPRVVVALGGSAAQALLRRPVAVQRSRGTPIALDDCIMVVTNHPSYLLRLPDRQLQVEEYGKFVSDLTLARHLVESSLTRPQ